MEDITKTGPEGLQGVDKEFEKRQKERDKYFESLRRASASQLSEAFLPSARENIGARLVLSGYGQSTYDDHINSFAQLEDINEVRAQSQPWTLQILGGIGKGISLAATTFLNGTAGALIGLGTGIYNIFDDDPNSNFGSGFWNSGFAKGVDQWNNMMEELMPSYYSEHRANVANWIGDKFLKNLGFAIGAYYSGGVYSMLLKATRLPYLVTRAAQSAKVGRMFQSYVGSLFSAVNEGSIEALNGANQWYDENKADLDEQHGQRMNSFYDDYQANKGKSISITAEGIFIDDAYEEYKRNVQAEEAAYKASLAKLEADKIKMGNATMLLNIPVLTLSNHIQFAKLYARGFKTGRKIKGVAFREGENSNPEAFLSHPKLRAAYSYGKMSAAEGAEEISQAGITNITGDYYTTDVNNFYKAKTDRKAEMETLSVWKSLARGINKTVNDSSAWEEFLLGSLTGAVGIPLIKGGKITLEGGFRGARQEYLENKQRGQKIVDRLNARMQDPKFKEYYQGLIRHRKLQDIMDDAVERGKEFDFKNAEFAQFVSDIMMFDNVGRLDVLEDLIRSSQDYSDQNISDIIKATTSTLANGKLTGPFIEANGKTMSNEKAAAKLKEVTESMLRDIDNYIKIKNDLDSRTDERFTDEQLEELVWMRSQMDNWSERAKTLGKESLDVVDYINGHLLSIRQFYLNLMDKQGLSSPHRTAAYDMYDRKVTEINRRLDFFDSLKALDPELFSLILAENKLTVTDKEGKEPELPIKERLLDIIETIDSRILTDDKKADFIQKIDDAAKMGSARKVFADKYNEYLEHPERQQEDHARADQEAAQAANEERVATLKNNLLKAKSRAEFREILDKEEDEAIRDQVLKTLEEEGNAVAKNYRETSEYDSEFRKALQNSGEDAQMQQDVLTLWEEQSERAEDVESLSSSEVEFDEDIFLIDSGGDPNLAEQRLQKAKYALQKTISAVNNGIKFRDRFAKSRPHPSDTSGTKQGPPSTGTSATRQTDTSPQPAASDKKREDETPVGEGSFEDILRDNKTLVENAAYKRSANSNNKPKKRYLRPAIPEIHIVASKEGDFRPFDVVIAEGQSGADFSEIYNYLKDNGAFGYVNEGHLKPGDTIRFMIDPEYEERIKGKPWHKAPTVFMVTQDGQIVGSLDEGSSLYTFEGLEQLLKKVRGEYQASRQSDTVEGSPAGGRFVATPQTKVSKIMVGKVAYTSIETNLSEVEGVKEEDAKPIFGIVKNGALVTNEKLDPRSIRSINDISNKEGALYLLVPNPAGTYNPIAVRVKHFNAEEFNINDATVADTLIGKSIIAAINQLADCQNEDDLRDAVASLAKVIYKGALHINWISNDTGGAIQFVKVEKDAYGNEVYEEVDGKKKRKEDVKRVFLTKKSATVAKYTRKGKETITPEAKDHDTIVQEIIEALLHFNLPIQVSAAEINTPGYNQALISSGVLTSNIKEAKVISNWFITDYIDSNGKVQKADPPAGLPTSPPTPHAPSPVEGKESVINGITVKMGNLTFTVDLEHSVYIDANGNKQAETDSNRVIFDLAWAQQNYGDATESSIMTDNKIILPDGKVLDRTTGRYLKGAEGQKVKDKINGVKPQQTAQKKEEDTEVVEARKKRAEEITAEILDQQQRVNRSKTDGNYWYIEEENGELHPYDRIHKRLGNNWRDNKTLKELADVESSLKNVSKNKAKLKTLLKKLETTYEIDLSKYKGERADEATIKEIVNKVQEAINNRRSKSISTQGGSAVDAVIREFFTNTDKVPTRPDIMSEKAFKELISTLEIIRAKIQESGERFLANNLVLFHKYADGTRIAGEVDILAIDKDGNFKIYDIKTSKYSFQQIGTKLPQQTISTLDYYTLQLSGYQNLFESEFGVKPITLALLPFVLTYDKNVITSVKQEKGIPLTYNSAVNVPLEGTIQAPQQGSLPIFNATIETMGPINRALPDNTFEDEKEVEIGYYEYKGKIYRGYLKKIAEVNGTSVYVTKVRDMGIDGATPGSTSAYYLITPNGASDIVIPVDSNESHAINAIKQAIDQDPAIINDWMSDKTRISEGFNTGKSEQVATPKQPEAHKPAESAKPDETKPSEDKPAGGAAESQRAVDAVNKGIGRKRHKLREATESKKVWDKQKELSWLAKVLPQMAESDRLKFTNGLIYVADQGAEAWGMFSDGIITLSDIAAEGTTYHEAFHAVFNLMLTEKERVTLFNEARRLYGDKSLDALEEDMAEGFREYVMVREQEGLFNRIRNFFKDLWIKVSNWNRVQPHLYAYYQRINQGKYKSANLRAFNRIRLNQEELTSEMQSIKGKAITDGTFMRAPNGRSTNLNERQWLQVRTKAFKDWFGDWENNPSEASKVVDENGEPLVVYHGSPNNWNVYNPELFGTNTDDGYYGKGLYLSSIKNKSAQYGNVMELFVNIKAPIRVGLDKNITIEEATQNITIAESFNRDGDLSKYDGVLYSGGEGMYEELVVPTPNQIKSATSNTGEFSTANNDIRYRLADTGRGSHIRATENGAHWDTLTSEQQGTMTDKGWTKEQFDSISSFEREHALQCIGF